MSAFADFGSGFFGSVANNLQANMDDERALDKYKKQLDIQEEMRKKAEEAKVAAAKMFTKKGSPNEQSPWISKEASGYVTPQGGPDQLMVEEFNSQGRPIGVRPASASEMQSNIASADLAQKTAAKEAQELQFKLEDRDLKKRKDEAYINRQNRPSSGAKGGGATPKGQSYQEMLNDVTGRLRDPEYLESLKYADPGLLAEINQNAGDKVTRVMGALGNMMGVKQAEDPNTLWAQLKAAEGDEAKQVQILKGIRRRMEEARAKALARGVGVRNEEEGDRPITAGGLK